MSDNNYDALEDLDPEAYAIHTRLQNDLVYFAEEALKVKDKSGQMVPFAFNHPQRIVHERLERQLAETGKVRAIVLKARQEGVSTYVAARYYHKSTRQANRSVFILSHEAQTTEKLFRIVERYQDNCPAPLRPRTKIQNRREYRFADIGSEYSVGTAGNENVGRGGTIQFFHGSEVAFWENTDGIQTGIMQSIADLPGTEIIMESTANGMGNMFYDMCMSALAGTSDYILIFLPWFWMPEYRKAVPADFVLTREEEEYAATYKLDLEQICWRRFKIEDLGSEWKFKQEYPANPIEAFQTSGSTLIRSEAVMNSRRSEVKDTTSPLVGACDPGRNRDRAVIAFRRGRQLIKYFVYDAKKLKRPIDEMWLAGKIAAFINAYHPEKFFIDCGNGYGVYDRLVELGYGDVVVSVLFGEGALEDDVYRNKRAEMWCNLRDWIQNHENGKGVSIPDLDELHADLCCMPDYLSTSGGLIYLVPKDEIRKKFKKSPDIGDAVALTFAFPVRSKTSPIAKMRKKHHTKSQLKTLRRMRGESERQPIHALNLDESEA